MFEILKLYENLAQINLILTDKTGTLTKHIFTMISCYIDGEQYGEVSRSLQEDRGLTLNRNCKAFLRN